MKNLNKVRPQEQHNVRKIIYFNSTEQANKFHDLYEDLFYTDYGVDIDWDDRIRLGFTIQKKDWEEKIMKFFKANLIPVKERRTREWKFEL